MQVSSGGSHLVRAPAGGFGDGARPDSETPLLPPPLFPVRREKRGGDPRGPAAVTPTSRAGMDLEGCGTEGSGGGGEAEGCPGKATDEEARGGGRRERGNGCRALHLGKLRRSTPPPHLVHCPARRKWRRWQQSAGLSAIGYLPPHCELKTETETKQNKNTKATRVLSMHDGADLTDTSTRVGFSI